MMIPEIELLKIGWLLILSGLTMFMLLRFYLIRWWRAQGLNKKSESGYKVKVILPCKGVEINLEKNIEAIQNQTYKNYSLVGVVDSKEDTAYNILIERGVEIILSDHSYRGSGKVKAVTTAIVEDKGSDVIVIVDSDTTVNREWLENLISPLDDKNVGVTSTYPLYEPISKGNLWDYIKKVWGYLGINMMEFRLTRFVWGGSAAFKKEMLQGEGLAEFSSSISDDATLTKICKEKKLRIAYSKSATPMVYVNETRKTFFEWANRQMAISVSFSRKGFYAGIAIYGMMILYLVSLIPLSILFWNMFIVGYFPLLLLILFNYSRERSNFAKIAASTVLLPFVYLYNLLMGKRAKEINWRGSRYRVGNGKI